MRLLLIVLGWMVCGCALLRAAHVAVAGLWVRAAMVASWALLAAGVAVTAMLRSTPNWSRAIFAVGLIVGTAAFAASHFERERV